MILHDWRIWCRIVAEVVREWYEIGVGMEGMVGKLVRELYGSW